MRQAGEAALVHGIALRALSVSHQLASTQVWGRVVMDVSASGSYEALKAWQAVMQQRFGALVVQSLRLQDNDGRAPGSVESMGTLHVTLSASLCPPVVFARPQGLKRWSEALALAQAAAADAWGLPMDQAHELVCALDIGRNGLAAALMKGTRDRITEWAGRHRGHLVSLEPLWAVATRARACRASEVRQLTLHEPDALSVVPDTGGAESVASGEDVRVRFSLEALPHRQQWPHGPAAWDGHWERLA